MASKFDSSGESVTGSDSLPDTNSIYCDKCDKSAPRRFAVSFCTCCMDYLCAVCINNHTRAYSDHNVIFSDIEQGAAYINVTKRFSVIKQELTQTQNEAKTNLDLAERYRDNALEDIKKERVNINQWFDEQKARINAEFDILEAEKTTTVNDLYVTDCENLKSIITETDSIKNDFEEMANELDGIKQSENGKKLFTVTEQVKEKLSTMKVAIRKTSVQNDITKYRFEPTWLQEDMKISVSKFGKIISIDSAKSTANVRQVSDINIHSVSDTGHCAIKGMCLVNESLLVAADSQNKVLKVIDTDKGRIVGVKPVRAGPRDVTMVTKSRIATTLPGQHKILFFKISATGALTDDGCIEVDGVCRGITCCNSKLVVSFDFPSCHIEIMDFNGAVQQKFELNSTLVTPDVTPSYSGIAVSPDNKLIYVADEDSDMVICFTMKGKVKAIYRGKYLKRPHGVTVDNNGLVYVCGQGKVHQLSADLATGRVVLDRSHGIRVVQSVVYCDNENILYTGMLTQNAIKAFKIQ